MHVALPSDVVFGAQLIWPLSFLSQVENLVDVVSPVEAILRRCNREQIMLRYCIPEFKDTESFLTHLARKMGRLKKGKYFLNRESMLIMKMYVEEKVYSSSLIIFAVKLLFTLKVPYSEVV